MVRCITQFTRTAAFSEHKKTTRWKASHPATKGVEDDKQKYIL